MTRHERQVFRAVDACFKWIVANGAQPPTDVSLREFGIPEDRWERIRKEARAIGIVLDGEGQAHALRSAQECAARHTNELVDQGWRPPRFGQELEDTRPVDARSLVEGIEPLAIR